MIRSLRAAGFERTLVFWKRRSGQDLFHYIAGHIGQPEVSSLELIGEPQVIDSKAIQDSRLQVMDVHGIFDDVVGVVVGLADGQTALDAAASHPY